MKKVNLNDCIIKHNVLITIHVSSSRYEARKEDENDSQHFEGDYDSGICSPCSETGGAPRFLPYQIVLHSLNLIYPDVTQQVMILIEEYLSFPTNTLYLIKYVDEVESPAFTFCPKPPVRHSSIPVMDPYEFLKWNMEEKITIAENFKNASVSFWNVLKYGPDVYLKPTDDLPPNDVELVECEHFQFHYENDWFKRIASVMGFLLHTLLSQIIPHGESEPLWKYAPVNSYTAVAISNVSRCLWEKRFAPDQHSAPTNPIISSLTSMWWAEHWTWTR